jgi:nitroreductase
MDFQQVVQKRRMVRAFREEPLAREVVERILANGNRAPSAGFTQGYGFLVLEEAVDRARFWETVTTADHQPAAEEVAAPLLVIPLACKIAYLDRYAEPDKGWTDRDEAHWPIPYWYIDTGFAALLMLLTAVDEGLGGLFFGLPPEATPVLRTVFGVPDDHEPIGVIAIGQPAPGGSTGSAWRGRRPLDQVVHRGHW